MRKIDVVREYVYKSILAVLIVVLIFDVFCGKRVVNISINPSVAVASLDSEEAGASSEGVSGENNQPVVDLKPSASSPDIEMLIRKEFGDEGDNAIKISTCESSLNPSKHSTVDLMADGRAFSIGLFQINLTVSEVGGIDCTKAFSGRNSKAVVIDEQLYSKCVRLAENPNINLESAKDKFNRSGWERPWTYCYRQMIQ